MASFVCSHYVLGLDVGFLQDALGWLEIIGNFRTADTGVVVYEADHNFVANFGEIIMEMGDVFN